MNPPQATVSSSTGEKKAHKGLAMEGWIATWYTRIRRNDQDLPTDVARIRSILPAGDILEVAPGPGYLAIELAKHPGYKVVGLDISRSFVQIARRKAAEAGVEVDFRPGNAAANSFPAESFDLTICAAFKNFTQPVQALQEMWRVPAWQECPGLDLRRVQRPTTSGPRWKPCN
jgi:ubiquinone/menaquinone biosynthesis C-methylase UbiE